MIDIALRFLVRELDSFARQRTPPGSEIGGASLSGVVGDNGNWPSGEVNKDQLLITLVSIEEERTLREQAPETRRIDGRDITLQPGLKLNLNILISSYFENYEESLRHLSLVYAFFQSRTTFSLTSHPDLAPVERITTELQSPTLEQLNQMWAFLGVKHRPSALYRLRLVRVQEVDPWLAGPPILTVSTDTHDIEPEAGP